MINLFIDNKEIVIEGDLSSLKYYQLPVHLDLDYNKIDGLYKAPFSKNNLIETILYYKTEGIKLNLSNKVSLIFNNFKLSKQVFEENFYKARDYKNGKYDKKEYNQYISFLKDNLKRQLYDHQKKASYHLYLLKNAANFSVPGSGKTSVVIAAYKKMLSDGVVDHLYIAGPASSAKPWRDEYAKTVGLEPNYIKLSGLDKTLRKIYYYGEHRKEKMFFTTYNTINNDKRHIKYLFKSLNRKILFVLDEAHYIKRLGGEWAESVMDLAYYADFRCILTGTPLPKDFTDIFNMMDFLWLERSPLDVDTKNQIQISNSDVAKEILNKKLGPLFYRVRKKELGLKPPKFHPTIFITQNKNEKQIYDLVIKNIRLIANCDDKYKNDIDLLYRIWRARLIRLRQVLSYPKLIGNAINQYKEDVVRDSVMEELIINYDNYVLPAKLEYLIKFVKELNINGLKVLIWSNFIDTIKLISNIINKEDIKAEKIIGSVPSEKENLDNNVLTREKIISNFLDGDIDVLIANPAACAESISLHKNCFHAIYYDLSYNLAQYLQSIDRIHRVGGSEEKTANYYFLQYTNTVEYKIKKNLDKKKKRMYDIIEKDFSIYDLYMSEEDDIDEIREIKEIVE